MNYALLSEDWHLLQGGLTTHRLSREEMIVRERNLNSLSELRWPEPVKKGPREMQKDHLVFLLITIGNT